MPQAHTCDNTLCLPNYWEGVQQPVRSSGLRLSSPRHSKAQNAAMEKLCKEVWAPPSRARHVCRPALVGDPLLQALRCSTGATVSTACSRHPP